MCRPSVVRCTDRIRGAEAPSAVHDLASPPRRQISRFAAAVAALRLGVIPGLQRWVMFDLELRCVSKLAYTSWSSSLAATRRFGALFRLWRNILPELAGLYLQA